MIINYLVLFCGELSTYLSEERLEIQAIADDVSSKYVPPHVNIFGWLSIN
jgi:hypothetical protein